TPQLGVRPFGCKVDVQQPTELMREKEQQSVSIPCSVTVSSCSESQTQISWYVFRRDSHYQLDLQSHSLRYTLEQQDLRISSLSEADSGVYYCAAALLDVAHSGAQAIGQGTTLKVSKKGLNVRQALLLTLLVLLIVYSLLVLVIIICIKVQLQYTPFQSNAMLHFQEERYKAVIGAVDTKANMYTLGTNMYL
uniref:Si:ch211-139g16.8 n=1 Tax=Cyprinus carpio carpio TaxID=630221 RepID=A0A8C1DTP7_CYPCA